MSTHETRPPSEWMPEAACLAVPELPWTTDTHDRTGPAVLGQIMADTCAACPVRSDCAAYADSNDITGGFWSGADRDTGRVVEEQATLFTFEGAA